MFGSKIKLDKDLLERCKNYAKEAGYSSVEECITHILEKELKNKSRPPQMDKDIEKQLKGLGYIE
jgi:metal-responsive CopG/Arc/MetJ family transcriptional regulator